MEALSRVTTVALDKTGTLTFGTPEVVSLDPCGETDRIELLRIAASAERYSDHPVSRAIAKAAAGMAVQVVNPERFSYTPGKGISCMVGGKETLVGNADFLRDQGIAAPAGSSVAVAHGGVYLGSIGIADVLRPE